MVTYIEPLRNGIIMQIRISQNSDTLDSFCINLFNFFSLNIRFDFTLILIKNKVKLDFYYLNLFPDSSMEIVVFYLVYKVSQNNVCAIYSHITGMLFLNLSFK